MKSILSLIALAFISTAFAEDTSKDNVNAGEQIKFNGNTYHLKWSGNPSKNYYKQEYLQTGSTLEGYSEMITVDVLVGNTSAKQACQIKVEELKKRKKSDPVTNHAIYEKNNSDEIVLDFTICDGEKILEWNLYRYIEVKKGSKKYLVLIAYTNRDDLQKAKQFFDHLKSSRNEMVQELDKIVLPNMKNK